MRALTQDDLEAFERELRRLLDRLSRDAEPTAEDTERAALQEKPGRARQSSGGDAAPVHRRDEGLDLRLDENQQLSRIERALQRIEEGSYGECVDCGARIDPARLDDAPWTLRCARCERAQG